MQYVLGNMLGGANGTGRPSINKMAFMGDSITEYVGTTLNDYESNGYASWVYALTGCSFDFIPSATKLSFATGGFTTTQIGATWLTPAIASDADSIFVLEGTNDSATQTSQQTADRILTHWLAIKAAGKTPIGSSIWPVVGNATKSAWIVATNAILRSHASANGIKFCDWTGEIENVPNSNTGVSNTTWLPDNVHPGLAGAIKMGQFAARFLRQKARLTFDPYAGKVALSRNPQFAGSAGQANDFNAPFIPTGATLNSKTLVADPVTGGNWWQLDINQGTAPLSSTSSIQHNFSAAPDLTGETVIGMGEIEVLSGELAFARAIASYTVGTTTRRTHIVNASTSTTGVLTSADGLIRFRTRPMTIPSLVTYYTLSCQFSGTAVVRIRRCGLYRA
jgi:hypothetical protein